MPARRIPPPSPSFAAYTSAGDTDAGSRPARTIVASLTCDASDGIDLASLRATGATTRSHQGRSLLTSFSYRSRGNAAARTASRRLGTAIAGRKIAISTLKTAAEVARAPTSGSSIGYSSIRVTRQLSQTPANSRHAATGRSEEHTSE